MKDRIRQGIDLANAAATLLRTTALTVGPPLLRLAGDRDAQGFAGLVTEKDVAEVEGIGALRRSANAPAIDVVCGHCRSNEVTVAAQAHWDTRQQEWVLSEVDADETYCSRCGMQGGSLQQRPLRSVTR